MKPFVICHMVSSARAYEARAEGTFPREPWLARRDADAYGVVLDARGKIAWGRGAVWLRYRLRNDAASTPSRLS